MNLKFEPDVSAVGRTKDVFDALYFMTSLENYPSRMMRKFYLKNTFLLKSVTKQQIKIKSLLIFA
jgi:hypothetical protein